jgi:hypothetical protein
MSSNTSSPTATTQSQLAADILAVAEPLRELIRGLVPKEVPLCWAPEVLAAFAVVERVAGSGRMLMTARAAEAGQWERERFASPADWLAEQLGTTAGRARADLETSERLGGLDATSDAVRAGLLSPEQAGAVADAAAVNPEAEGDLLGRAQHDSLRRTRLEAERRKAEVRNEREKAERDERVRRERGVRFWYANGAGNMSVSGPVADLKELEQLIQREVDKKFRANLAPALRGSRANYAFDALMGMGRGATPSNAGSSSAKRAPLTRMTLVRVDLAALKRGRTEAGELCEIGGVCVSVTELRHLLGDSVMQLVLTNGEAVIDVVNLNRKPTVAQMVAKLFCDSTCTAEGCDRAARLEFDHRDDWARVLVTELVNLDLLCDHHHDLKTYENWQLVEGTGRRPMVPPTDVRHPDHSPESDQTAPDAAPTPAVEEANHSTAPVIEADAGIESQADARIADLAARLARIKSKDAEQRARRAGQNRLFETG